MEGGRSGEHTHVTNWVEMSGEQGRLGGGEKGVMMMQHIELATSDVNALTRKNAVVHT